MVANKELKVVGNVNVIMPNKRLVYYSLIVFILKLSQTIPSQTFYLFRFTYKKIAQWILIREHVFKYRVNEMKLSGGVVEVM